MGRIRGRDLLLFKCSNNGVVGDSAFACSQSCDLSINAVYEETSDKDTGLTPEQELTRVDWSVSVSHLLDTANGLNPIASTFEELKTGAEVYVAIAFKSGDATTLAKAVEAQSGGKWTPKDGKYFFGKCKVESITFNTPHDGKATASVQLKGAGDLQVGEHPATGLG